MTTTPTPTATDHARTPVEQLILDLCGMWLARYDAASHLPRGNVFDPTDPTDDVWRATTGGLSDAWTSLYLLGLLRTHAPKVAEHAVTALNSGAPDLPGEQMPKYVLEWAKALRAGRSLLGLLP